jgi:glycosyltransferase involved in cell wall biosynthesis
MAAFLVYDVRANNDSGVSRYGLSLLSPSARALTEAGWRISVVARPGQERRAVYAVDGLDIPVTCAPDDEEGFVRRSPWLRQMLVSERADLYFTSHYLVDRDCPVPFVFTVHDLTRLRMPEFSYTDATFAARYGAGQLELIRRELKALAEWDEPEENEEFFTRYFRAANRYLAHRAAGIVTVSQSSANDIESMLSVPPERLAVVPGGVARHVFTPYDQARLQPVLRKYGLARPYLIFVGLTHPNKRFPWLLEQLLLRRASFPPGTQLVAVGGHAENTPGLAELLARHQAADFVSFTGRVSDPDLAALYSGASALVIASVSEGSNLPALEAVACGCPVIATDIPPLREILGTSAAFYNPASGAELTRLAAAALAGQRAPRESGAGAFSPPSWTEAGRRLARVLAEAAGHPAHPRDRADRSDRAPEAASGSGKAAALALSRHPHLA